MSYFEEATGKPTERGRLINVDADLSQITLGPGLTAKPVVGRNLLGSFVRYEPGATAPRHSHVEEQLFIVLEGQLEIDLDGDVRVMGPGDAALIPAWVPHSVRSFEEPAYQLDVFSPPRAALLELLSKAES